MATTPAETSVELIQQAKVDLAAALRAAALYGYNEGVDNHFSLAVPGRDDRFLLNPALDHHSTMSLGGERVLETFLRKGIVLSRSLVEGRIDGDHPTPNH